MDSITEQLSQLQELNDEQLSELENSVLSEFDSTETQDLTPQTVDKLEQLANAVEAVRTEKARRVAAMEALTSKAQEAAQRVRGSEPDGDETNPDPEGLPPEQPEDLPVETPAPGDPAPEATPQPDDKVKTKKVFSEDEAATTSTAQEEQTEAVASVATPEAPVATETPAAEPDPAPADAAPAPEPAPVEAPAEPEAAAQPEPTETPEASESTPENDPEPEAPAEDDGEAAPDEPASELAEGEAKADEAEAEAKDESESTTDEATASDENTNTNPEANVTAAAQGTGDSLQIEPPADRKPQLRPAATMSITAGADIPNISAGTRFNDMLQVADAFSKRLHSLRHVHGGDGEQHIVASLAFEYPEDRVLEANDPQSNTDKIFDVTSPEAITAAAGICLPLETRYDMGCDIGVTDRPVRDALARFAADRGGIRFFTAPTLADEAAATGFWRGDESGQNFHTYGPDGTTETTPADQKPCLEVQCTEEVTAYIEAVTLCLTFNNLTTRTFPELIKRHNDLALVAHARIAENHLLAQIEAGSTAVTARDQVVGAAREIFNLLGRAVATYRFKHRMNSVSPLRMIAPMWVLDLLRADLALQMPGDGMENTLGAAETQINNWFRSRGVNVTWHLDGVGPVQDTDTDAGGADTAVDFNWPDTIEFALFAEGTWLYLDGGTLDLGVIRDSGLVATNQYKQFVETFEGVANMGCDSYWVSANYVPTGQAAALVDTL